MKSVQLVKSLRGLVYGKREDKPADGDYEREYQNENGSSGLENASQYVCSVSDIRDHVRDGTDAAEKED